MRTGNGCKRGLLVAGGEKCFGRGKIAVVGVTVLAAVVYPVLLLLLGGLTRADLRLALRRG